VKEEAMNCPLKMVSLVKIVRGDSQTKRLRRKYQPWVIALIVGFTASFAVPLRAGAQTTPPTQFASAKDALHALISAAKAKDRSELAKIFGSEYDRLLSGDQVEDDKDLADFAEAVQESAKLRKDNDAKYTVIVGKDNWPTPIPIVQKDSKWEFDAAAGLEEVLTGVLAKTNWPPSRRAAPTRSRSGSTSLRVIGITTASPNMPNT